MVTDLALERGRQLVEEVDLTDPETFAGADLGDYWRRLRRENPVYWHPEAAGRPGFWVVSRYADAMTVYRDNQNYTSEKGNVLVTLLAGEDSASGRMLAVTDGPRHRDVRNVLLKAFSPRAMAAVTERVRENTHRLVADAVRRGRGTSRPRSRSSSRSPRSPTSSGSPSATASSCCPGPGPRSVRTTRTSPRKTRGRLAATSCSTSRT